ncbi:MAG: hypothetical protein H8F28_00145, partial [Fibrella sp.]|nr:hypothetical protein [Armatimonadota bacterium]
MRFSFFFRYASLLSLLFLVANFAGAQTNKSDSGSVKPTKLVVWGLQLGKDSAGLEAQIAEFERRNPDIDVSVMSM